MAITRRRFAQISGLIPGASACASAFAGEQGFQSLFDGRTLTGWDFDGRLWMVDDHAIRGTTTASLLDHDEFAIPRGTFRNFVFRTAIRLGNYRSGIVFRGIEQHEWAITGLEIAAQDSMWGDIRDHGDGAGRVLARGWPRARAVFHPGGWNQYEIACRGRSVTVSLNGTQVSTLNGIADRAGVIGLGLTTGPAMQVWFRDIRIKVLPD